MRTIAVGLEGKKKNKKRREEKERERKRKKTKKTEKKREKVSGRTSRRRMFMFLLRERDEERTDGGNARLGGGLGAHDMRDGERAGEARQGAGGGAEAAKGERRCAPEHLEDVVAAKVEANTNGDVGAIWDGAVSYRRIFPLHLLQRRDQQNWQSFFWRAQQTLAFKSTLPRRCTPPTSSGSPCRPTRMQPHLEVCIRRGCIDQAFLHLRERDKSPWADSSSFVPAALQFYNFNAGIFSSSP
jgi:hypothetical protein